MTRKRWVKVGVWIGGVIAALVIVGLILPTRYEVSRSVVVAASRGDVHALLEDLHAWQKWEPWTEADPSVAVTYGPQTVGVGASQSWTDAHGGGELTLTMNDPEQGIAFDMLFDGRYPAQGMITHDGPDGAVRVTWLMTGDTSKGGLPVVSGYLARLMPGMIGPMFDRGLEKLKHAAETR